MCAVRVQYWRESCISGIPVEQEVTARVRRSRRDISNDFVVGVFRVLRSSLYWQSKGGAAPQFHAKNSAKVAAPIPPEASPQRIATGESQQSIANITTSKQP